jgi:hypothetical protein
MKMQELQQQPDTAGWLATLLAHVAAWWPYIQSFFWKFMPAPLGALAFILFDPPATRKELFLRFTVSYVFGSMCWGFTFSLLHSFSLFSFLDIANRHHTGPVEFFTAGVGWSALAVLATYQRKLRETPPQLPDVKNIVP